MSMQKAKYQTVQLQPNTQSMQTLSRGSTKHSHHLLIACFIALFASKDLECQLATQEISTLSEDVLLREAERSM